MFIREKLICRFFVWLFFPKVVGSNSNWDIYIWLDWQNF